MPIEVDPDIGNLSTYSTIDHKLMDYQKINNKAISFSFPDSCFLVLVLVSCFYSDLEDGDIFRFSWFGRSAAWSYKKITNSSESIPSSPKLSEVSEKTLRVFFSSPTHRKKWIESGEIKRDESRYHSGNTCTLPGFEMFIFAERPNGTVRVTH